MNGLIKQFLQDNFADYKSDLFAAFIVRSLSLSLSNGYLGFMSPFVWMFISSYEELRNRLISEATITTLVQLEYSGFDGATVPICTFALQNKRHKGYRGGYVRLSDFRGSENQSPKTLESIANPSCGWFFRASSDDFKKIPGSPIAYWVSKRFLDIFSESKQLSTYGLTRLGMTTANNAIFTRQWHEVGVDNFCISAKSAHDLKQQNKKWVPYNKGGFYRKWYGNMDTVLNWEDDGFSIRHYGEESGKIRSTVPNTDYYFKECITWSKISSGALAMRFRPCGSIFDVAGACIFSEPKNLQLLLAFCNSAVALRCLEALSPTLNFEGGHIASLPICESPELRTPVEKSVPLLIDMCRADWDNFETSWDFRDQPLLRPGLKGATLEASWRNWEAQSTAAIRRMQELETENNRLFIAAYGLDGELQPEVPEAQITLARAEARRDMAAFLSYAVGCMMGRYSPDHPGLILANAGDTLREFLEKVGKPLAELTFAPDEDGIIPVLDGEWFEDDIVARTRDFLRATFGEATLRENLRFLEDSLGKDLRKYFLTDFYKDHLQTYKKRPIYWLVSSGKQRAFQCLVYLHRYHEGTLARMRTEYAIPLQGRIAARIEQLDGDKLKATSTSHRNKLQREQDDLKKQQTELLTFEEKLKHAADQKISLDLDDGVKVNYGKFGDLLAESKAITGGKDDE